MRKLTFALMFFLTINSNAQVKPTSTADRLKISDQKKALLKNSLVNQIAFRNIGPSVMSGRVVDIDMKERFYKVRYEDDDEEEYDDDEIRSLLRTP